MPKVLVIQTKDFGDAIIAVRLLNLISLINGEVHILSKPIFKRIFSEYCINLRGHYMSLPIGKTRSLRIFDFIGTIIELLRLRKENFDIIVSYYGDIRDHLISRIIGGKIILGIMWGKNHPYVNKRWNANGKLLNDVISVDHVENIYDIIDHVFMRVCKNLNKHPDKLVVNQFGTLRKNATKFLIGIHPFAGKACAEWAFENWVKLIEILVREKQIKIVIFSSPEEEKLLKEYFGNLIDDHQVSSYCRSALDFMHKLSEVNLFVGLDSFAIHAASFLGAHSILLNGANDPAIWAPPNSEIFSSGSGCSYYPCFNQPRCIGTDFQYICINGISPQNVAERVLEIQKQGKDG